MSSWRDAIRAQLVAAFMAGDQDAHGRAARELERFVKDEKLGRGLAQVGNRWTSDREAFINHRRYKVTRRRKS